MNAITRRTALAAPALVALPTTPFALAADDEATWKANSRLRIAIASAVLGVDPAPAVNLTDAQFEDGQEVRTWCRANLPGISFDWLLSGDPRGLILGAHRFDVIRRELEAIETARNRAV